MRRSEGGSGPRIPPLPPGLVLRGGDAAWEVVLRELPDPAALPAWETLRCVRLWLAADPSRRAGLFRGGAQARRELELIHQTFDLDLVEPLSVLAGLLAEGSTEPGEVVWACLCVAEWANLRGARETGGLFAETAALAEPENPGLAFMVGRMARSRGDAFAAEHWLKRAAAVAWRVGEWEVYARSVNSLGNLRTEQGRLAEARHVLAKALRASRRHTLQTLQGEILHDLFAIAAHVGDRNAEDLARQSFELYKVGGHPRLPALAHDIAYSWMSAGYFGRALSVLRVLPPHIQKPDERLRVLANTARAAGSCGQRQLYEQLWTDVWALANEHDFKSVLAPALTELGLGASSLGEWSHAAEALKAAVEAARVVGDRSAIQRAEEALAAVRQCQGADTLSRPTPPSRGQGGASDSLMAALLEALAALQEVPARNG